MKVEIQLYPNLPNYAQVQAELGAEIDALYARQPGLTITKARKAPPEGALGLYEVYQFLISHADDLKLLVPFVTALLQVTREVLRRRATGSGPSAAKATAPAKGKRAKTPSVRFVVDGRELSLPASNEVQRRFLASLTGGSAKPTSASAQKKGRRRR